MVTKGGARPGAGRPTKRTPELVARLLEVLAAGNTRKAAYDIAGISSGTFATWLEDDLDFKDAVKKAESDAVAERVARIRAAGIGGAVVRRVTVARNGEVVTTTEEYARPEWQADAWLLERKYPDDFGRKDRITMEHVRREAERIAKEQGLDVEEVMAEAEAVVRGAK